MSSYRIIPLYVCLPSSSFPGSILHLEASGYRREIISFFLSCNLHIVIYCTVPKSRRPEETSYRENRYALITMTKEHQLTINRYKRSLVKHVAMTFIRFLQLESKTSHKDIEEKQFDV